MDRNCNECIHHISGFCDSWECDMQTLEDYRNNIINEVIKNLNNCDRYVAEQITHCLSGKSYPQNEVFVVDDIYEIMERVGGKNE